MFNPKRHWYLFTLVICVFLASCTSVRKDGPPNFYVDETKIPNAVPKVEPKAKSGNMTSYVVFGKRYYTMKSSKGYHAVGLASWYGTKFHTQHTSSGERYNMLGMTAAHKTLPLPTYVEVTNLRNNKKIIVKVNDRGPFESNRLIDLSYVAAKKLGMIGHGTAHVAITAIDPLTYHKHPGFSFSATHTYSHSTPAAYLQVGAFRSKQNAEHLRHRLINLLHTPVRVVTQTHSNLYHVQVGPLHNDAMVNRTAHHLKMIGMQAHKINGA